MRRTRRAVAVAVLAAGALAGIGAGRAEAQPGVPYGPYSMTRSQFNRNAPVYYPRLTNNWGLGYYGRPRYYGGRSWGRGFRRGFRWR